MKDNEKASKQTIAAVSLTRSIYKNASQISFLDKIITAISQSVKVAVTTVGLTSLQIWTCVQCCMSDTLHSDVSTRSIAVSAAAIQKYRSLSKWQISRCVMKKQTTKCLSCLLGKCTQTFNTDNQKKEIKMRELDVDVRIAVYGNKVWRRKLDFAGSG